MYRQPPKITQTIQVALWEQIASDLRCMWKLTLVQVGNPPVGPYTKKYRAHLFSDPPRYPDGPRGPKHGKVALHRAEEARASDVSLYPTMPASSTPLPLLGQATEYPALTPQSGSSESDNTATAHLPHTTHTDSATESVTFLPQSPTPHATNLFLDAH